MSDRKTSLHQEQKLQALGRQVISTLYMLVRNVRMYDPDNAVFDQPFANLRQAINTIVAMTGSFSFQAVGTTVYVNDVLMALEFSSLENVKYMTDLFEEKDVGGFHLVRPIQVKELKDFIWIFSAENEALADEHGVEARKLTHIKVGRFAKIKEVLDKLEEEAIQSERKVDRKKYAMTVYARTIFYLDRFTQGLRFEKDLPPMQPATRLVRDFVDICDQQTAHFLGMSVIRSEEKYLLHHSANTCLLSIVVGQELGMSRSQRHELGMAALFHDIGMAEIDQKILSKKRRLTKEDRRVVDLYPLHTVKSLLRGRSLDATMATRIIAAYESKIEYSKPMRKKDGKVKLMLPKVALGLYGRIISIAACYDALTSNRPFREAYGPEVAMTLMVSELKYRFDPWLLEIFMRVLEIQPVRILEDNERKIHFS